MKTEPGEKGNKPNISGPDSGRRARARVFIAPVALWFAATFFLLGRLGKWVDDYGFHHRDPVSGGYDWRDLLYPHWHGFFRPLHVMFVSDLHTVFFHQPAVVHLVAAAGHGLAAWALYRVLIALNLGRAPALAASVIFLTYPAGHEVPMWPSACSASLSTALALAACLLVIQRATRGRSVRGLGLMFLAAFAAPCFYEQPATALGAAPLVYLAACRREEGPRSRFAQAALVGAICLAACSLYIGIMIATISDARGATGSYTKPENLGERLGQVYAAAKYHLLPREFWAGALTEGAARLRRALLLSGVLALLLVAGFRPWIRVFGQWTRRGDERPGEGTEHPRRPGMAMLIGATVFLLSWLPVVAVNGQGMASRLTYTPILGLCIVLAGGLAGLRGAWRRLGGDSPWPGVAAGAAALAIAVAGSIAMIGIQSAMQRRWRMDTRDCATLRALIPNPPRNAVFMPLGIGAWPTDTGSRRFDQLAWPGWSLGACSTSMAQFAYRRADIASTESLPWAPYHLDSFDDRGVWYNGQALLRLKDANGRQHIEWSELIPFIIDKNGRLKLVDRFRIDDGAHAAIYRVCPEVMEKVPAASRRSFNLPLKPENADPISLGDWRWVSSEKPVTLTTLRDGHGLRPAIGMHPRRSTADDNSEMTTTIPPLSEPARVYFRVRLNPRASEGDGVEYAFFLPQLSAESLAVARVRPQRTPRWAPIEFDVPAHREPLTLRVVVGSGEAGNTLCDWSYITPGMVRTGENGSAADPGPAKPPTP